MTTLLARDGYEEWLTAWTVVFPKGGFPNVHAERLAALDGVVTVNAALLEHRLLGVEDRVESRPNPHR